MINWKQSKTRAIPAVDRLALALHLSWATIPLQSDYLFQRNPLRFWFNGVQHTVDFLMRAGRLLAMRFRSMPSMLRQIVRRTYWRLQLCCNKESKLAELSFMCGPRERVCVRVWVSVRRLLAWKFKCRQLCIGQCDERHCAQYVTLPPSEQRWNPTDTERACEVYGEGRQNMCGSWGETSSFCLAHWWTLVWWCPIHVKILANVCIGGNRIWESASVCWCIVDFLSCVRVFDRIWHMHYERIVHRMLWCLRYLGHKPWQQFCLQKHHRRSRFILGVFVNVRHLTAK